MWNESHEMFSARLLGKISLSDEEIAPDRRGSTIKTCFYKFMNANESVLEEKLKVIDKHSENHQDSIPSSTGACNAKPLFMMLEGESLNLVDPKDASIISSHSLSDIKFWGTGVDPHKSRAFAFIVSDASHAEHNSCFIFRCDFPAKKISDALQRLCQSVLFQNESKRSLHSVYEPAYSTLSLRSCSSSKINQHSYAKSFVNHDIFLRRKDEKFKICNQPNTLSRENFPVKNSLPISRCILPPLYKSHLFDSIKLLGCVPVERSNGIEVINESIDKCLSHYLQMAKSSFDISRKDTAEYSATLNSFSQQDHEELSQNQQANDRDDGGGCSELENDHDILQIPNASKDFSKDQAKTICTATVVTDDKSDKTSDIHLVENIEEENGNIGSANLIEQSKEKGATKKISGSNENKVKSMDSIKHLDTSFVESFGQPVYLSITPSTILIKPKYTTSNREHFSEIENGDSYIWKLESPLECKLRYLSFLGIGHEKEHFAFVCGDSIRQVGFSCYVFFVKPNAGKLAMAIEQACNERYRQAVSQYCSHTDPRCTLKRQTHHFGDEDQHVCHYFRNLHCVPRSVHQGTLKAWRSEEKLVQRKHHHHRVVNKIISDYHLNKDIDNKEKHVETQTTIIKDDAQNQDCETKAGLHVQIEDGAVNGHANDTE